MRFLQARSQHRAEFRPLARGFEQFEARTMLHAAVADVPEGEGVGSIVSDFNLLDVNPASPTYNQVVSPRDYVQQATLWYFGHAT